jgi:hypothetical protein
MKILHLATKSKHMNTLETFHTYKTSKKGIQLNEVHSDYTNPIYDTLTKDLHIPFVKAVSQQQSQESLPY